MSKKKQITWWDIVSAIISFGQIVMMGVNEFLITRGVRLIVEEGMIDPQATEAFMDCVYYAIGGIAGFTIVSIAFVVIHCEISVGRSDRGLIEEVIFAMVYSIGMAVATLGLAKLNTYDIGQQTYHYVCLRSAIINAQGISWLMATGKAILCWRYHKSTQRRNDSNG